MCQPVVYNCDVFGRRLRARGGCLAGPAGIRWIFDNLQRVCGEMRRRCAREEPETGQGQGGRCLYQENGFLNRRLGTFPNGTERKPSCETVFGRVGDSG